MGIPLSSGYLNALKSDRFKAWNYIDPEIILVYWDFAVNVADNYEEIARIKPSQKRAGCLLEELVKVSHARFRDDRKPPYDDFFRGYLNGESGYSAWFYRDPIDKVTSSYAALNQLECDLQKPESRLSLFSAARLLEYGVRVVHEDAHNHFNTLEFNGAYDSLASQKENLKIKEGLELIKFYEELYVHLITVDFVKYFLRRFSREFNAPAAMPFCGIQFPPTEDAIRIVGDKKTLSYLGIKSEDEADFEFDWDRRMLLPREQMVAKAEKEMEGWFPFVNNPDPASIVAGYTSRLLQMASLPTEEFNVNSINRLAQETK